MLRVGLNPYGLGYTLGRQGHGTKRANPEPRGLDGFISIAEEIGARTLELPDDWLAPMDDAALATLQDRLIRNGMTPVISSGLQRGDPARNAALATALGAHLIRLALTSVLCGDRAVAASGWTELVAGVEAGLARFVPAAEAAGVTLVIENHQDLTSGELAALCERFGPAVRIVFDTGNTFPVAEAPLDFTRVVAPYVHYVHLKDYRVQWTDEGFRLVRCAIGDGAVPLREIADLLAEHHPDLPATLELGALDARHVRLFTPGWWQGYPAKSAADLAACLAATRRHALPPDADHRTPWERNEDGALVAYELDMIYRSAANMRAIGLMEETA